MVPVRDADLAALLDRVPGWAGRPRRVAPLGGGITNWNYRVDLGGEVFVVRVSGRNTSLLGIDRRVESEASRLAARAGVGPEVLVFLEDDQVLVTRFIDGRPVTDEAVHQPQTLTAVARSLRQIHAAGVVTSAFSPFRVVDEYARTARAHGGLIPYAYETARATARAIEAALPREPACLCHNDLLNANFIAVDGAIRIVDWEYAGMGDRFFDLGNFAVNHQLTEREEEILLEGYFGNATAARRARLRLMRIMSDFREAMWGVVQQTISAIDFDFRAYATRHFDRLGAAAADPRLKTWLRRAGE